MFHLIATIAVLISCLLPINVALCDESVAQGNEVENNTAVGGNERYNGWNVYVNGDPLSPHLTGYGGDLGTTTGYVTDYSVKLVSGGTFGIHPTIGNDRAANSPIVDGLQILTYGGPTDTWGHTWTPTEINSPRFGNAFAVDETVWDGPSNYFLTYDYHFDIPSTATITGIQVDITYDNEWDVQFIDEVVITVYFTE